MFERFTDMAREVIVAAQNYANQFGHSYIGTEHLLLALSDLEEGVAGKALISLGITSDIVKEKLLKLLGENGPSTGQEPKFTSRVKRVLELALKETYHTGNQNIATEHILLAILREGEGMAMKIIAEIGVQPNDIRKAIAGFMNGNGPQMAGVGAGAQSAKLSGSQMLDKYGRNLTQAATEGKLDPVIGRETEVERIMQILSRRTKNNPILIGEPGVGKTAVVEGLAQKIVKGSVPETLKDKKVYVLDLTSMVAGSQFRGMFEDRLKKVLNEVVTRGDIILFIDEIHTLVGAGNAEGSLDAASILKPMLARGELQTIGATTLDEYRKYFEKDKALERRFQPVKVPEPTILDAIEILKGLRDRYETHHHVTITDEAIDAAVKLSARYVNDRFLPDKAIDLIDEAGARLRIERMTAPDEVRDLQEKINKIQSEIDAAAKRSDYNLAADLKSQKSDLDKQYNDAKAKWEKDREDNPSRVDGETIAKVLEMSTGIPVYKITEEETKRLLNMEDELHKRVIGQNEAIKALSKTIRRTRAGLKDPKRPSGSFIFAGPTGVGKTELAKALAEFLFGDESALIQIDMSEYGEKYEVSKMIGAAPGYVGYDEGGQLTEKVRRKPFSVVLFDEIEKAHPDVFNILLQVLEDGHLTDGSGRIVDFKNTVIIMTTNLGSNEINRGISVGFSDVNNKASNYEQMRNKVREDLKKNFRPEFLNRLDDVIVFPQLSEEEILKIVNLLVAKLEKRLEDKNIKMVVTDSAKKLLAAKGFDPVLGARPLRRTITRELEDELSEKIIYGDLKEGQTVTIDSDGTDILNSFTFSVA
ncbi:MAG: ATP-dependent Clp protease ATP-binding subunit [Candidatus Ancillula sp.]|jgi:ATP-dependent Clp protease ATP-binding subunit ClpC|nr:ATP-dependent Clp protease ATP-binding subunit [Candidatus Ancillula sp.]